MTIKSEYGNIYKLSAREQAKREKKEKIIKFFQKTLKKCLTRRKYCGKIDKLSSRGGRHRAVARQMQIKNGIRKK